MIVGNEKEIKGKVMESIEMKNAAMKVLVSPKEGWNDHVMRVIELGQGGYTPKHTHPWPHINYILEGRGVLQIEDKNHTVEAGAYAYVPAETLHQFRNDGSGEFRFICIVPEEGHIT